MENEINQAAERVERSLIRFMRTSSDLAWVWQPRSAGTDATK